MATNDFFCHLRMIIQKLIERVGVWFNIYSVLPDFYFTADEVRWWSNDNDPWVSEGNCCVSDRRVGVGTVLRLNVGIEKCKKAIHF